MSEYVNLSNGAAAVIGVLAAFCAFWSIGLLVPGRRFWEYPLLGWAFVYLLSVVAALCGIVDLRVVLTIAAAVALTALIWRRPTFRRHSVAPYLTAIPLLALSLLTPPIFVDSYSHWLPNASYLYQLDRFPEAPLGNFFSLHPTYPNGLPLVIYISSLVTGRFTELAGNVLNALLFLIVMGCIWRLLRETWPTRGTDTVSAPILRYLIPAIAFCVAIPLNPAIDLQYYWSAIADPALAVLTLVIIIECCRFMARKRSSDTSTSLLFLFALGCLASGLKPNAWPLAIILGMTAGFIGIVHGVPARRWGPPALAIVGGTLLASGLWKLYLQKHLPIADQFVIRPLADWSFHLWKDLFIAMLRILRTQTIYSVMVLLTLGVGFLSLIRRSLIINPTMRLMVGFVSVAMAMHLASLIAAYLGTGFEDWMIKTASSFPRYTTQVGYAVCAVGVLLLALKVAPYLSRATDKLRPATIAAACLVGCGVLFVLFTLRPTLALEDTARERHDRRKYALAALQEIPAGHRVAAVAAKWSVNYLRYVNWAEIETSQRPFLVDTLMLFEADDDCQANSVVKRWQADPAIDDILIVDAHQFAARCAPNAAPDQIWRRSAGDWQVLNLGRPIDPNR